MDISFEDEILRTKTYLEDIKARKDCKYHQKEALIKARLDQFRRDVEMIEPVCRVTGLDKKEFLIVSHKILKDSDNYET